MPGPDPSNPISTATGVLRAQPNDAGFEADFAALAARFAQSGGGLSPELSADLALEIVLNEIVEQACLTTGATGAAIVLQRDGELVCRASSGATAPELGARLDSASGLSGECIRTRRTQRCDDVLADQRVNLEASARLGVRSVMVLPLLQGEELVGVLEVFSSLPGAFGERDERTLEALAGRILNNLVLSSRELAAQSLPAQPEPATIPESLAALPSSAIAEPIQEAIPEITENSSGRGFDFLTASLAAAVLACAVLLGVLLGRHLGFQKATVRARPPASASNLLSSNSPAATSVPAAIPPGAEKEASSAAPSSSGRVASDAIPAGSLLVYENGKEVFRQSPVQREPARQQGSGMQRAASIQPEKIVDLSPAAAEDSVVQRVEPEYPESAREMQLQGPVVLEVRVRPDGGVQEMTVVSGQPLLVQAAKDAVRQWRFRPRSVSGQATAMQTRITLNFRLPQ